MKGKTIKYSVSVAILATMMQAAPTFAAPVTQNDINATQQRVNDFETKIQKLDNQIIIGMDKSQKLNDAIKAQQGKIEEAKSKIEKAKKDLEAHKAVYSERLRSIQSQGQPPIITYAELLLSSKDISQFLTRSTAISQILQSDSDLLNSLKEKQRALTDAEQQLNTELDKLKKEQDELASEQQKIEAAKQEIEKQLADAKNTLQQQQSQMAQQIAQQQAAQRLAQQQSQQQSQQPAQPQAQKQSAANSLALSTPVSNGANLTNSDKAQAVIATAKQFLGVPYVWGGSSPSGFDCSGLMQYVFRSVGVNLPRTAHEQQNVGTRISPSQVQPGDLVFQGVPAYHVGMYIGNGQWIQAPETGDVVKISPYNPSRFSSAARVLK